MRIATRVGRNTSMSFGWPVAAIYALIALFVFIAECLAAFAAGAYDVARELLRGRDAA